MKFCYRYIVVLTFDYATLLEIIILIGIYQYGVTLQLNHRTELNDVSIRIIIAVV